MQATFLTWFILSLGTVLAGKTSLSFQVNRRISVVMTHVFKAELSLIKDKRYKSVSIKDKNGTQ